MTFIPCRLVSVIVQVRYKEDLYNKAKYKLDQTVAEEKRKLEEEDRRLASLDSPEDIDKMAVEHDAAIDELRVQIEVRYKPLFCFLTDGAHRWWWWWIFVFPSLDTFIVLITENEKKATTASSPRLGGYRVTTSTRRSRSVNSGAVWAILRRNASRAFGYTLYKTGRGVVGTTM